MLDPRTPPEPRDCSNCGAPLTGRFCVDCGQKASVDQLRMRSWISELWDLSASLETRMWTTFIGLTVRPGKTVLRYLQGQRIRFTSPLKYAVLGVGLWLFSFSLVNSEAEDDSGLVKVLTNYGQLLNLLALPFLAGVVHLVFRGSRFTYAEHLCLCLYMVGHAFVWRAMLAVAGGLGVPGVALSIADQVLFLVYSIWMVVGFHAGTVRWMWMRAFGFFVGLQLVSFVLHLFIQIVLRVQE